MTGVFSILGFVAQIRQIESDIDKLGPAIIARACEMVCARAKAMLGTYQDGWPALQPETIARKMRGDSPLLETGEMRDSIEWNSSGLQGYVGSNNDRAVWMELGTSKVPPRPFLSLAAAEMEDKIHRMAAKAVKAVIRGEGMGGSEMRELLHILKHAAHDLKGLAEKVLEEDEGENHK
jgi:phage gpG-like protein